MNRYKYKQYQSYIEFMVNSMNCHHNLTVYVLDHDGDETHYADITNMHASVQTFNFSCLSKEWSFPIIMINNDKTNRQIWPNGQSITQIIT